MLTPYLDEPFGSGDTAQLVRNGTAWKLTAELAGIHQPGAEDPFQLLFATRQGWTLVTKDRDYEKLHYLWSVFRHWQPQHPGQHAGILWTPGSLPNSVIVARILDFFRQQQGRPPTGQLWVLGDGGRTWTLRPAFA